MIKIDKHFLETAQANAIQVKSEIENLQNIIAKTKPKIIVEIGSADAGTIGRFLQIPSVELVVSVDKIMGIHGSVTQEKRDSLVFHCKKYAEKYGFQFEGITGDSQTEETKQELVKLLNGRKIDALFIDADHRYNGVKSDYVMYAPLVKEGGIISFHDIIESEWQHSVDAYVDKLWKFLKVHHVTQEFINREESCKVIPASYPHGCCGIGILTHTKESYEQTLKILPRENKNTISIITGCYNGKDSTKAFLDSVLGSIQHNPNTGIVEIFVHNNGSTDGTREMLEAYATANPIVKPIHSEMALGYSRAFNFPVQFTSGEYVVFMNNDVTVYSDWLDRLIKPFSEDPTVGISCPLLMADYRGEDFCLGSVLAIPRTLLEKYGLIDEGFKIGYYEDNEISRRIQRAGYKILGVAKPVSDPKKWGTEMLVIDFPLNHSGGSTFNNIPEREKIYAENGVKEKFYYKKHNKNYVVVPQTGSFLEFTLTELLKEDPECMIVVVCSDLMLLHNAHHFIQHLLYSKNVHVIPQITKDNEVSKSIGKTFFGSDVADDNLFYLVEEEFQNKKPLDITWLAKFDDYSSMGILSQKILANLTPAINASIKSIIGAFETKDSLMNYLLARPKQTELGIAFTYPDSYLELGKFKKRVIYTGADTTGGIPNFASNCNQVHALITPSDCSRQKMLNLGVTKPIFVFPHGVDTDIFPYVKREDITKSVVKDFNFLYIGEISDRKGVFQLVEAFKKIVDEFDDMPINEDVLCKFTLTLCGNTAMKFYNFDDVCKAAGKHLHKKIKIISENKTQKELSQLMQESHCYINCSRAETFGMVVPEAMSTGLPVISNNNLGVCEFVEGKYYPIESKETNVVGHPWMLGKWQESNVQSICEQMIYVLNNYTKALEFGKEASEHVHKNLNWKTLTEKFSDTFIYGVLGKNIR